MIDYVLYYCIVVALSPDWLRSAFFEILFAIIRKKKKISFPYPFHYKVGRWMIVSVYLVDGVPNTVHATSTYILQYVSTRSPKNHNLEI